jgi:predicted ATPase
VLAGEWDVLAFVGRTEPLARLTAAYQAVSAPPGGAVSGWAGLVLVTGEAGIGKTTLLTRFASRVRADAGTVVWGTCWDGDQAPAWWPWTKALRAMLDQRPNLAETVRPELAAIVPELATNSPVIDSDTAARVRVFDAAGRTLSQAAASAPLVVILDDLHSADQSSVDLLRFVAHEPQQGALMWSAHTGRTSRHLPSPARWPT